MKRLFFQDILLANGWATDVMISVSDTGHITDITSQSTNEVADISFSGVALAGMPNVHSHAFQFALAGLAETYGGEEGDFWTWRTMMYDFTSKVTPEDAEAIAAKLYLEMIKAGYTSIGEFHYLHHDQGGKLYENPAEMSLAVNRGADLAGISQAILPVLYQYSDFGQKPKTEHQARFYHSTDHFLGLLEILDKKLSQSHHHNLGMAFHSLRAVDMAEIIDVSRHMKTRFPDAPIHIHIAEQMKEVAACIDYSGMRPVEYLMSMDVVDDHWSLIHATHVSDDEVTKMAKLKAVAGICPTTEANLGDGIFPAADFKNKGGIFAIGSDSHVTLDPFDELRLYEYGQRLKHLKRGVIGDGAMTDVGAYLWHNAVIGGGQSLRGDRGAIEVGNKADIIVLDPECDALYAKPKDKRLSSLVFTSLSRNITDVVVQGQHVLKDGYQDNEEQIQSAWRNVMKKYQ